MPKLTRRQFLLTAAAAGATILADRLPVRKTQASPRAIPAGRVVHTHSPDATCWDYATGWYGDYVSQTVVDAMTDRGVMALTGTHTLADAWGALLPAYTAGQKVAIKVNVVNATCDVSNNRIDALPQPINSVIRGLKSIGVAESDIDVYDVTYGYYGYHEGAMPARLVEKVLGLYPQVQFDAYVNTCPNTLSRGFSSTEVIHFNVPSGKPEISDRPLCNALVQADYLINMPVMKKHGRAGVTLGFKNHFGSIERCDYVHWSVELADGSYTADYNGLVDIYNHAHIKNKTVLTVGDALYAARLTHYDVPEPWPTFDDHSPNSLFFSVDPVAIDSVMVDFLNAEGGVPDGSDDYLVLAAAAGLGVFERWDDSQQYHEIDYRRLEIIQDLPNQLYLPLVGRGG
jgi:uncharacterized protein (DUF362 family)